MLHYGNKVYFVIIYKERFPQRRKRMNLLKVKNKKQNKTKTFSEKSMEKRKLGLSWACDSRCLGVKFPVHQNQTLCVSVTVSNLAYFGVEI